MNPQKDYTIAYAENENEFDTIMRYLIDNKLVQSLDTLYSLTFDGWKKYEELQRNPPKTNQAFVAMWFGKTDGIDRIEEMKGVYDSGIKKAVEEANLSPKMKAMRIDLVEHNDPIDDRILVEIRRSRFMVADFTGHRGGVYFEAGYTLAHGIPVIWTCKKDEADKMHFDTRQFSRIEWETPEDLYEKLKRRIEGSIF